MGHIPSTVSGIGTGLALLAEGIAAPFTGGASLAAVGPTLAIGGGVTAGASVAENALIKPPKPPAPPQPAQDIQRFPSLFSPAQGTFNGTFFGPGSSSSSGSGSNPSSLLGR